MADPDTIFDLPASALVDDEAFSRAYDSVGDLGRARIKLALSGLYSWLGPPRTGVRETVSRPAGGECRRALSEPLDFALIVLDASAASPAKLLAALMPALMAGVPRVAIVGLGMDPWPDSVLCALELGGQEEVYALEPDELGGLMRRLGETWLHGAVACLGSPPPSGLGLPIWTPGFGNRAAVYAPAPDAFDWEAMDFAHPDTAFTVYGHAPGGLPERFTVQGPDEPVVPHRAVFAPEAEAARLFPDADLVLGPGMEACWAWPGLGPSFFTRTRLAWGRETRTPDP